MKAFDFASKIMSMIASGELNKDSDVFARVDGSLRQMRITAVDGDGDLIIEGGWVNGK